MNIELDPIIFNWLVYLQMPFWFFFYHQKSERWEKLHFPFIIAALFSLGVLTYLKMCGLHHISNYPIPLVSFYVLEVLACYILMNRKGHTFPQRISLSFLLSFFSSYFWEFPLHILDLIENGLTPRFVIQAIHLLPLVFFSMLYEVEDWRALISLITTAHMITTGIVSLEMLGILSDHWTYAIRVFDFTILLVIFANERILQAKTMRIIS